MSRDNRFMPRVLAAYPAETRMGKESGFTEDRDRHREENTTSGHREAM